MLDGYGSIRFHFKTEATIYPYVFVGGSLVDSERKMTPTINAGAGATHWISDKIGINAQIYYKHSLESFSSMRTKLKEAYVLHHIFVWTVKFKL